MTFSYNTGQAWTREGTASEAFLISTWTRTPAATPPGSNSYDDMLLYAATPPGSKSYVNAGLSTPEGSQLVLSSFLRIPVIGDWGELTRFIENFLSPITIHSSPCIQ